MWLLIRMAGMGAKADGAEEMAARQAIAMRLTLCMALNAVEQSAAEASSDYRVLRLRCEGFLQRILLPGDFVESELEIDEGDQRK